MGSQEAGRTEREYNHHEPVPLDDERYVLRFACNDDLPPAD